jgi:hypothetical protein
MFQSYHIVLSTNDDVTTKVLPGVKERLKHCVNTSN